MRANVVTEPRVYALDLHEIGKIQKRSTWSYVNRIARIELIPEKRKDTGKIHLAISFLYSERGAANMPVNQVPFDFIMQPVVAKPPFSDQKRLRGSRMRIWRKLNLEVDVEGEKMAIYVAF